MTPPPQIVDFSFLLDRYSGLPRTGFATPTHSATMAIGSQRNLRAFLCLKFVSHFSLCGLYVLPCLPIFEAQRLEQ